MVEHPTLLRGAAIGPANARPLILQRTDDDFLAAVLHELRTAEGRVRVRTSEANDRDPSQVLRLFQPVHRTFHPVLMEAVCDRFGEPRLDPARIESAGVVIRRMADTGRQAPGGSDARDAAGHPVPEPVVEGWMRMGRRIRGWVRIPSAESRLDPDPARRRPPRRSGDPAVTRLLPQPARVLDAFAETVSPLFLAPPEVCEAAGRTLLYGLIPLASAEQTETPSEGAPVFSRDEAREALPPFLRAGTHSLRPGDEDRVAEITGGLAFLTGLGVFEGTGPGTAFLAQLDTLEADVGGAEETLPLGEALGGVAAVFANPEGPRNARTLHWTLSGGEEDALADALGGLMAEPLKRLVPGTRRYDLPSARYRLYPFMRARVCDACPPELVWGPPSEPFTIVPWYESGAAPPVQVPLPDITKREALKKLKPDVAFIAPREVLRRVRATKLQDTLEGKEPSLPEIALNWVCGFNIPIITICALIVLYIFLNLLNLIFRWLPYILVCFPLPSSVTAPSPEALGGGGTDTTE